MKNAREYMGASKDGGIYPKIIGFNTKMVIHDLDGFGYPHDIGNHQIISGLDP